MPGMAHLMSFQLAALSPSQWPAYLPTPGKDERVSIRVRLVPKTRCRALRCPGTKTRAGREEEEEGEEERREGIEMQRESNTYQMHGRQRRRKRRRRRRRSRRRMRRADESIPMRDVKSSEMKWAWVY